MRRNRHLAAIQRSAVPVRWNLRPENATLLKKVNLPKLSLPIIVALSGLSNFAVILLLFLGFLLTIGSFTITSIVAMIPLVCLVVALALGLGVLLGTINVSYRDVEPTISMLVQFWFWLTPIVYPAGTEYRSSLPQSSHGIRCGRLSISRS